MGHNKECFIHFGDGIWNKLNNPIEIKIKAIKFGDLFRFRKTPTKIKNKNEKN